MEDASSQMLSVFAGAIERPTPQERVAFLDKACGSNVALRERIEALLRAHDEAGGFLSDRSETAAPALTMNAPLTESPGTLIGPYKLLEQIGEGGFGVVFMAEQQQPLRRKVALKVIKAGMDTRQVIARFEAERQALALMDHPNIAKVLDAGATASGRPYFVMELVRGVPITAYCDGVHLNPRERLELFVDVCHAVQHAHQKGIIHRDIKPSNVLITPHEGKPMVKVIDFGIAKATGQQLTEKTLFTNFAQMVGTPLYMSPEQAGAGLDIDTRSDIYGLGVLLYELLTGSTPFDKDRLKSAAFEEIRRIIREEEPPRPSTKLSGSATLASVAAMCKTEPKRLSHLFRGEVDWIVMKALEKDRARRYETANGFAMDIKRYLNDEPVLACPPSAGYRVRKFIRRNKGPVAAAAVVALTLVGGIIGTTMGFLRADHALQEAQARAAETTAALDFVETKVFAAARPIGLDGGQGVDVTLRDAINAAVPYVESTFVDHPLIEARLRLTLARSYSIMEEPAASLAQADTAWRLYTEHRGPNDPDTLKAMGQVAFAYEILGRHADALKLREESIPLRTATFGPFSPETLASMSALGRSYRTLGRGEEAIALQQKTFELCKEKLGTDHTQTLMSMFDLAVTYDALGRSSEGIALYEQLLATRRAKFGIDVQSLSVLNNLAFAYSRHGRHQEAVPLLIEALAECRVRLGVSHVLTRLSIRNLASSFVDVGRDAEACELFVEARDLAKAHRGADHRETLIITISLAGAYQRLGRHADNQKLLNEALPHAKAKLGTDDPITLELMLRLSDCEVSLGRHEEAFSLRTEVYALSKARFGADHPETRYRASSLARSHADRGADHAKAGRVSEAIAEYDRALSLESTDFWLGRDAAVVYLYFGDMERYRRACRVLLERAATLQPQYRTAAGLVALICALAHDATPEFARVQELAEQGIVGTEKDSLYRMVLLSKGLCEHRAGRPEQAITWLRKVPPKKNGNHDDALAFAALALAEQRLGRTPRAREALISARVVISANQSAIKGPHTLEWAIAQILCREAESLLGQVSPQELADGDRLFRDRELAALNKAMEQHPGSRQALFARAQWLATHGRFDAAERDFERLIEMIATDHWLWYRRACLLAYLGKKEAFEAHGRAMLKQFADSTDSAILDRTTKPLLLVPDLAGADLKELERRVDLSLKLAADSSWAALLKGMVELRAGRNEPAATWLTKSRSARAEGFPARVVAAGAYLAIAQHQLGQLDEAKATLTAAMEEAKTLPALERDDLGKGGIENWLIAQMALREAEATILGRHLPPAPVAAGPLVPPLPPRMTSPAPFRNQPAAVPGHVEAENFDNGGQGIAYHDTTDENLGQSRTPRYRLESVDIDDCADTGGGFNIGGVLPGEWLAYTVEVAEAGPYDLDLRLCSPSGGRMHVEFAGKDLTGPIKVPKTGWGNWVTVSVKGIQLDKGRQVMRVVFDAGGSNALIGNLNWIEIKRPAEQPK